MRHLEHNAIIHRDIAARNVLVGASARDVKLADLGAARTVFRSPEQTYIATNEHTPARWMSLEALVSIQPCLRVHVRAYVTASRKF